MELVTATVPLRELKQAETDCIQRSLFAPTTAVNAATPARLSEGPPSGWVRPRKGSQVSGPLADGPGMVPTVETEDTPLKLTCPNCGAEQTYCATVRTLKCAYCASETAIPGPAEDLPPGLAEAIVPLAVSEQALIEEVQGYLITGTLTPDDLLLRAAVVRKDRFYVPVFEFTGSYEAQWTASFGYDRTEHYTVYENRTENGRTRQVPVTKTRTVTDWRPASGRDEGRFAVRAYAGQRLAQADPQVLALAEDDSLGQAVPYQASYTLATEREAFAQTSDAAYQARGRAHVNARVDAGVERHGQGDRQRDWHWTAQIRKQHRTLLVPMCHVVYEYEGQQYHFWSSGADGTRWVADPLPVDRKRTRALAWGLLPLGIAVIAAPMAMKALNEMEAKSAMPSLALLLAGAFAVWRYRCIVGQSLQRRQSLLAARRAGHSAAHAVTASTLASLTSGKAALITTCLLAGLLPALPFVEWPQWSAPPVAVGVAEPPPPAAPQPVAAKPRPAPIAPTAPAALAPPESSAPQTPTEHVASVLVAATAMDWPTVDARLARMKALSPEPAAQHELDALNEQARTYLERDDKDRAALALTQVLAMSPQWPTAWSNLTEALTNPDAARSALRVAIRLSTNREKTIEYLRQVERQMAGEPFGRLAAGALREIHQIPLHPKDANFRANDQERGPSGP